MNETTTEKLRPRLREAKQKAGELFSVIERACQQAELHKSPGCAELAQALETAKSLHVDLTAHNLTEAKWKKIKWTLEFLWKVINQICSFINCKYPRGIHDEHWVNHKALA